MAEGKELEGGGGGEERRRTVKETMQAAVRRDGFQPGTQPEVKGVAEDDLRVHFLELARCDGFHRAVRADGHENRRLDHTMVQCDAAAASLAVGGDQLEPEAVRGLGCCIDRIGYRACFVHSKAPVPPEDSPAQMVKCCWGAALFSALI